MFRVSADGNLSHNQVGAPEMASEGTKEAITIGGSVPGGSRSFI